jgi:RNA polymerase sigma factor (sigma-70 family)
MSGEYSVAEDLAQETLLEAWRHRHKLRDASGADRWLAAVARNVCLRWRRRSGRELPLREIDVSAPDLQPEPSELEELIGSSLSMLPPAGRDVLVQHHVDELPQADIATRLGITEAAVSMRLSRGRRALRRALEERAAGERWERTNVWCTGCGRDRVEIRRDHATIAFRCRACAARPGAVYDLANPVYARLVDGLVRPTAILARLADWSATYFARGAGAVPCTRCSTPTQLRHYDDERRGLAASCRGCGEEVWSSVTGLALAVPEARAFVRAHKRVRTLGVSDDFHEGLPATVVRIEALASTARLEIAFDQTTLRPLAVR